MNTRERKGTVTFNCSLSFSRIHFSLSLQGFINETRGIRTPDTLIKSQVLYRLSQYPILGQLDSNQRNAGVKVLCLTAWRQPNKFSRNYLQGGYRDSNPGPPEPQSGALTNCAIPTVNLRHLGCLLCIFAIYKRVMGIEPTYLAWKASVLPLNYTRTIGVTGFEPATSWSQTRRSSQAEPHPDIQLYCFPFALFCCHLRDTFSIIYYVSDSVKHFFYFFLKIFYFLFFLFIQAVLAVF